MKLKIGGLDSRFIGAFEEKEIRDQDPLEYLVQFCNERLREFKQPITFRVFNAEKVSFWNGGVLLTFYCVEIEYITREWYIGYRRETYIGKIMPQTI